MANLTVFNFITLNGFYKGAKGDISWHRHGSEEADFSIEGLHSGNMLLFGRITYEMMASYWPTPEALKMNPVVAEGMNRAYKIVFSRTLQNAGWNNTRLINAHLVEAVTRLKHTSEKDLTVLGSGSIVTQLAEHHLIDSYQVMIDPVAIGDGTSIFSGLQHNLHLTLTDNKTFKSGVVLLTYQPMDS